LGPQARWGLATFLVGWSLAHLAVDPMAAFAVGHPGMVVVTGRAFKTGLPVALKC